MKKSVRALIFDSSDRLLLGLSRPPEDEYNLIGGHCEPMEHPVDALLREVKEEADVDKFANLDYLFDYMDDEVYLMLLENTPITPDASKDPDSEFSFVKFFSLAALPKNLSEKASDILYKFLNMKEPAEDVSSMDSEQNP